jgi:hypothetical protein
MNDPCKGKEVLTKFLLEVNYEAVNWIELVDKAQWQGFGINIDETSGCIRTENLHTVELI